MTIRHGVACISVMLLSVCADAQNYSFQLIGPSGLDISQFTFAAMNDGTLIGDYDETTNPTGTRTKPGLFGSFGSTENVPVPTSFDVTVSGTPQVDLIGGFQSAIDVSGLTIAIQDYQAMMAASSSPSLTLSLGFGTDGFRTREPTSLYPPGFITVPFGNATVTNLTLEQIGPATVGTLTPGLPHQYSFVTVIPANLSFSVDVLGTALDVPGVPVLLPMNGTLDLSGPDALLMATADFGAMQSQSPNVPLPEFTLPVPTLLPPGATANLVFSLMLTEISGEITAQVTTTARGVLVPEPFYPTYWILAVLPFLRRSALLRRLTIGWLNDPRQ